MKQLQEKMAGEITLSEQPGQTLRKWREIFQISQKDLADYLEISPSMVSDYEAGRRQSPGVNIVRKFVHALIDLDMERGGDVTSRYTGSQGSEAILDIGEFPVGTSVKKFIARIKGRNVSEVESKKNIYGYTIIDSVKAITTLESKDYLQIYGWSSERALIFTGVKYGRSPMIAIRTHPLKPAMVIYLQPEKIDPLAIRLSQLDTIPLITTDMTLQELQEILQKVK
jgi:putative transcriptional regulator